MKEETQRIDIVQGEGGGCFAAGTLISAPNGSIPIESIQAGDEVHSFDDLGKISVNKVTKVFTHENNDIFSFNFWGGKLELNKIHWILNGRNSFFQAEQFNPEECVVDEKGDFRPFKSLEFLKIGTVYNFWVENDHTYIADGIRVHNGGGGGGKGQVGMARTPIEDPEGMVYGSSTSDRFVSQSRMQIMDLVCEGQVKGLVRGARVYEGGAGDTGYRTARFIPYRSQIGAMEGVTAEIEQQCTYGIRGMEKRNNSITVQTRINAGDVYNFNFKAHEGPDAGKGHDGSRLWISSGPKMATYPRVKSVTGGDPTTYREPDSVYDTNGGDDFLSGNWKAYETFSGGKNHPAGGKSYDYDGTLPKLHGNVSVTIDEVKGKWSGSVGGSTTSWVPYGSRGYSTDTVKITQRGDSNNDYESIISVSGDEIDSEIDIENEVVDGRVVGPASGRRANPSWWAVTFTVRGVSQKPECRAAGEPAVGSEESIVTDGFEFLRSIFWNGTPILDSTGLLNFQQVSLNFTNGEPNGIRSDQAASLIQGTSKLRVVGDKLKGPTQEIDAEDKVTGNIISDLDDFAQVFRLSNKNCDGVTVNVRVGSLSVLLKEETMVAGQPKQHAVGTIDLAFTPEEVGRRGYNTQTVTPAFSASKTAGANEEIAGESGDLLRTSVIYMIQWKPVFNTPGEYREWPSLFRGSKQFGTGPNSEITANEEVGQIEETLWGKISYGYNKSTRINFARQPELVNRNDFLGWELRVIRTTPESISPSEQNSTFTDSIVEHYSAEMSYPNSVSVTSKFDAEYFSEPPKRAFDMEMLKVKIPTNYNPVLRSYGQNRGGCNAAVFHNATYKDASNQDVINTTGVYIPSIGGGVPQYSGGDAYVNGTEDYWDGNFRADSNGAIKKEYTNNPAWCFYDLMTSKRYGLGKHIEESLIDKWSLYEIAKYCDELVDDGNGGIEPRFTCNLLISAREEAFKVLNDMASVFRGMMYYHGGLIQCIQDSPKQPIYQFTNASVENGEFAYQSTSKKVRRNVCVVRYNDPEDEFKPAVEYVENLPDIKKFGIRELEVTAFGCTSRGQARRLGNWALISESLETESVGFTVGLEGSYLRPGDVFQIFDYHHQHKPHGGRTQKFETLGTTGAKVTLDREITGLSGNYDAWTFSMLTPSHYLDPSLMDAKSMNSTHYPETRNNLIQKVYFTAAQTRTVDGTTAIRFDYGSLNRSGLNGRYGISSRNTEDAGVDLETVVTSTGKWPITGFNTFSHNLTGDTQFIWTIEKSGVPTPDDKSYNTYKTMSIEEKGANQYNIRAIEHQSGKFVMAESGIAFDRKTFAETPADPTSIVLETSQTNQSAPPNSIWYRVLGDVKDSATVGFQVYVKNSPFLNADQNAEGVPHSTYLAARVDNIDPQGFFIPSEEGNQTFYFRAFAINAANGLSENFAEANIQMVIPKAIGNVIISSLSLINARNPFFDAEDKSTGPGTEFAYNTDIGAEPSLNDPGRTVSGRMVNASPTFGWQAGFVGLKPGSKAATNFKYRLTVRETSDAFSAWTPGAAHITNQVQYTPNKNIFYEITGLSSTSADTKFQYFTRLNKGSSQVSIQYDSQSNLLTLSNDGNPSLPASGPYREYDVVVEAHDDEGFSSAAKVDSYEQRGKAHLWDNGNRKDVEYTNAKGFDVMHVNNPRIGAVTLDEDIRNLALTIPSKNVEFTFNNDALPADTVGIVGWFSNENFTEEQVLSQIEENGQRTRFNANKHGFLVPVGGTSATNLSIAYNQATPEIEDGDSNPRPPLIYRVLFSFDGVGVTDPKTASFNITPLIDGAASFDKCYMMIAAFDSFDLGFQQKYTEDAGGATDENIISAMNVMSQDLVLSKLAGSTDNTIVVSDVAGQANSLAGYISVESINKVKDATQVRWTHLGMKSYNVQVTSTVLVATSKHVGPPNSAGRTITTNKGDRTVDSEYEHTATFDIAKIKFDTADEYMVRISPNVKRIVKSKDKIVWYTEIKGHVDLDNAMSLDIYRI
jgi:hypothetical protein